LKGKITSSNESLTANSTEVLGGELSEEEGELSEESEVRTLTAFFPLKGKVTSFPA